MNLKTYLQNVQARLEKATPGPWRHGNIGNSSVNHVFVNEPEYNNEICTFYISPDGKEGNKELIANCPTDLSTLLQIVKIQNDALSRFEYIDEVWALEKKDIYDIARQAIEQVNKLVSGGE